LLLWISTERAARPASNQAERRRKAGQSGCSHREEAQAQAWSAMASKMPATLQTAARACERKATPEIRGQTRGTGPTHRQKRWPTRSKTVEMRNRGHKRVFTRFASRRPQTPAQASQEASLDDSAPQVAERPCYEAGNSAGRGEWRREAGSPVRARLMSAWERESGELPAPICLRPVARLGGGLLLYGRPPAFSSLKIKA